MEYQQATMTLDWFIGFLEGEGCFINRDDKKCHEVRISNTEIDVLEACSRFLSKNYIVNRIYANKRIGKNKIVFDLYISGLQDCKILYNLVKNNMDCRINELEKVVGASTTTRETSLNLNWLIGLFEAEGCFTINTQMHKKGNISHSPAIIMENTNFMIIEKTVKTLYNLGLSWYIRDRVFENPNYKPSQVITIAGWKRVVRFLNMTKDAFVGSKTIRKVKLLTEFCKSRLSKESKEPYSNIEHQLAQEIKMKI